MEQPWWNSRTSNNGTVEQRWLNSRKSNGGTVEYLMVEQWNSATEMAEQGDRNGETEEQEWWNNGASDNGNSRTSHGGTVQQRWRVCGKEMVEQWNILWWNSRTSDGGTVEHLVVEQ